MGIVNATFLQLWKDYDAEAEAEAEQQAQAQSEEVQPLKAEYQDVIISDVRISTGLTFSVQILNTEGEKAYNFCLMRN